MPVLHLLAGPNGAGKSTYVRDILSPVMRLPFINADDIAAQTWPLETSQRAYEAARLAQQLRLERMALGQSFITETDFSHPSKVDLVRAAVAQGYLVHLHAILVPVEVTVQRVAERVRRGGHDVPEHKIRERYERLWTHIAAAAEVVDQAHFLDNSSAQNPFRLCAELVHGAPIGPSSWPRWAPTALTVKW